MRRSRLFLLFAPLLLGGCGVVPGFPAGSPATSPTAAAAASGPSWVVVSQGSVAPSATAKGRPSPTPSTGGFLPRRTPGPTPTPHQTCSDPTVKVGVINGLAETERAGTATVRWFNIGGDNVVSYRLTAIPQALVSGKQPDLRWQSISPGKACTYMTAVVTGLVRNAPYVLSLDAVLSHTNADGARAATVARSGVFYTT
jgi:hypothetical protein